MFYLTHTKRLFQLSLITLFASMLVLGGAGVNTALADHDDELQGKLVVKETCHNGSDKPIKRTIKSTFEMVIDPFNSNLLLKDGVGLSPFPAWDFVSILIHDYDGNGNSKLFDSIGGATGNGDKGIALTKNLRKGAFHTNVDDNTNTSNVWGISGVIVAEKKEVKAGNAVKKLSGKITGVDTFNQCVYKGKIKGKNNCPEDDCPGV